MSVGTARGGDTIHEYMEKLKEIGPDKALELVIAQTEMQRANAAAKEAEYKALAELEFDADGRIVKANMAGLWRLANSYARSKIVPEQYRGNPDDCFIACQMAFRWKADPMMVMQCSYVVHGKPGIEGKLAIALINCSGKIKGRVRYKFSGEGKSRSCTAYAIDKETGETVESTVTWTMAVAEGWTEKKGSKWLTIPEVMFTYRSATFLVRQYYPEVLMGMRTVDELHDVEDDAEPRRMPRTLDDLAEELGGDDAPMNGNGSHEKLSEGEIDPAKPEAEQWKPPAFDIALAESQFIACESLSAVSKVAGELFASVPAEHKAEFSRLETVARDRIAAARTKRQTAGAGA